MIFLRYYEGEIYAKEMIETIFKKIRNIILLSIMFVNINGSSLPVDAKKENSFVKNVITEIIGIDNTVVEFIEFITENN